MFKVTVKEAARARGVKTPYQLGVLLAPNGKREARYERMAERLWEGEHEPTLTTLALVMDALSELKLCQLSDLIKRVNGKKRSKR